MPAAFIGHGSPMNALQTNRYTRAWETFGASVPRPRAIVAVSAHWVVDGVAVTAMERPRTIHDFGGFPRALFEVEYPAPGAPDVAAEVAELARPERVALDRESWGLDHGTWSLLVHAFPKADVPVVQLAIDARKTFEEHQALARRLAPLRERGVLVLGSGNVVHNLGAIDPALRDAGFDWAQRFDGAAREVLTRTPAEAPRLATHPDYRRAAPTSEHFVPLLYLAGLADAAGQPAETLIDGCVLGSLSMTSYVLGSG